MNHLDNVILWFKQNNHTATARCLEIVRDIIFLGYVEELLTHLKAFKIPPAK